MSFERVVTVYRLERINNSRNGNPRYRVHTDAGEYVTSSDHSFVYGIENGWAHNKAARENGRKAWITLTRAGRITYLEYLDQKGS